MSEVVTLHQATWLILQKSEHWEFVRRPHANAAVGILAITPQQEILLVEQYRIPVQRMVIEIPAGLVGDDPQHANESLHDTAQRELLEETGYLANKITPLVSSPTSSGMTSELTHLFLATDLQKISKGGGVGQEQIMVHQIPLAELSDWLRMQEAQGKLIDFKIYAALHQAQIRLTP